MSTKYVVLSRNSQSEVNHLISKYETFMFDCDGVIWRGNELIPQANDLINALVSDYKKKVIFLTNNSSKSRKSYFKKFKSLGINLREADECIFPSSYVAAHYIKEGILNVPRENGVHKSKRYVYLIGGSGLEEEFRLLGVPFINRRPEVRDEKVEAVVFGFDPDINYTKYCEAFRFLTKSAECTFIATNDDLTYPGAGGCLLPGTGSLLAPLISSTGRKPTIMGKPYTPIWDVVRHTHPDIDVHRTCMIGDRLETDIKLGKNIGVDTILVLSGVTTSIPDFTLQNSLCPTYIAESVADLMPEAFP